MENDKIFVSPWNEKRMEPQSTQRPQRFLQKAENTIPTAIFTSACSATSAVHFF
jgi:hypothetical protein